MDKQEIVFISNFFGNGGAARVMSVLAEAFSKKGFLVTVYSFVVEGYQYESNGCYVHTTLEPKGRLGGKLGRIRAIRSALKKHPEAVIISFEYFMNMQVIVSAFGLKNRLIVSERNDPSRKGGHFPVSMLRNILYHFCDVLVCQTPDAKAYFPKSIQKKTVIIPNPVKEGLPMPWKGERSHEIVNFCRLEKQKNLPLLIDAFEQFHCEYSDYSLKIYGNGKEKEVLEKYIQEKQLQECVTLYEAVLDIHDRVLKSAMFVSSSDYEGLSNSMIEAMAIGLPTICTDCPCGGAGMVIENGVNGILVPVREKEQLVCAMKKVAGSRELQETLSKNGVLLRERMSVDKITQMWEAVM